MAKKDSRKKTTMRQVGTVALRGPDGRYLPTAPIYMESKDSEIYNEKAGMTLQEDMRMSDITCILAEKFKKYTDEVAEFEEGREKEAENLPQKNEEGFECLENSLPLR